MEYILASASPRRKELLKLVVPDFKVKVSKVEEKLDKNLTPEEQVMSLAFQKAENVFNETLGDRIVIGSDTIVTKASKIYGKPQNRLDAINMIKELLKGDKTHLVITGLCVIVSKNR